MRLSEVLDKYVKKLRYVDRASEATVRNYVSSIKKFISVVGDKEVNDVRERDIEEFLIKLGEEGYKESSILRHYSAIRSFLKYCRVSVDWDVIKPSRERKSPFDFIILEPEEVQAIIEYASEKNYVYGLMLRLGYEALLRAGELTNLKVSDIDFERCMVLVKVEKTGTVMEKPISMKLCRDLRDYVLRNNLSSEDYLFTTKFGKKWNPSTFTTYVFTNVVQELGINDKYVRVKGRPVRYHDFSRHTRATELLRKGVDIYTVNRLLGHKSIQSTLVYLHFVGEDLRRRLKDVNEH